MASLESEPSLSPLGSIPQSDEVASVVAPPPLIFLGFFGLGFLLEFLVPLIFFPWPLRALGLPALLVGMAGTVAAVGAMRRARTHVNPYRPTLAVLETGPFAWSRNPIHVSFATIYVGLSLLTGAGWPLLLLPAALLSVHRGVILREERYLTQRFGGAYLAYSAKVRRWL